MKVYEPVHVWPSNRSRISESRFCNCMGI